MITFNRWVVVLAALLVFTTATANVGVPPEPEFPEEAFVTVAKPELRIFPTVIVTAYNSLPNQTDNTPFETATGDSVFYGGVAVSRPLLADSLLPYGSIIIIEGIPDTFVVFDTFHRRFTEPKVDIWTEEYVDAINFGAPKRIVTRIGKIPRPMIKEFRTVLALMGAEKVRS